MKNSLTRNLTGDKNIENKRTAILVLKKYVENHPSIKQICENFLHKHIASLPYTTTAEVKKVLKEVMSNKLKVLIKFPQN